ncbi:universal stress protein [Actinokineospora sp. HUAS TT18]|uniref:universal stress protein n=1 Tax=Actinokineospora sp. HUAS TT18 TaxID=3447451 RepID=UPI003F5211A6
MTTLTVGVDHRDLSAVVLTVAADLGTRLTADLHIVHAVDLRDYPVDPDADNWESHADTALSTLRDTVQAALADFAGRWAFDVKIGEPAPVLRQAADEDDATMIIVGHHRHWNPSRVTRGSVGTALTRTTNRPVLLVPEPSGKPAERP